MGQLHALLGQLSLVLAAVAAIWAVTLVAIRRDGGSLFLASLVWLFVMVAAAGVLGVATAVSGAPPRDGLHVLYGIVAIALLPGAAVIAAGRPARQRGGILALAATVLFSIALRLLQTGG